jgi:hypothetical protein
LKFARALIAITTLFFRVKTASLLITIGLMITGGPGLVYSLIMEQWAISVSTSIWLFSSFFTFYGLLYMNNIVLLVPIVAYVWHRLMVS